MATPYYIIDTTPYYIIDTTPYYIIDTRLCTSYEQKKEKEIVMISKNTPKQNNKSTSGYTRLC
jgi:hypothetical protein